MKQIHIVFICLGNICRSPTAEAVMTALVQKNDLQDLIICDSAATSGHHEGDESDPRSISHAASRGYQITSISRPFKAKTDFDKFDYIVTMDDDNYSEIMKLDLERRFGKKVFRITQFCTTQKIHEVPDPYYGGPEGFEKVIDILEDACEGFLQKIKLDHKI